ncbi:MAG: hypothetical protein Q7T18_05750 [Sedimentisphaerales bacterium]|nr:hypothetical protein [Sedimentisphaerales bacterium]
MQQRLTACMRFRFAPPILLTQHRIHANFMSPSLTAFALVVADAPPRVAITAAPTGAVLLAAHCVRDSA